MLNGSAGKEPVGIDHFITREEFDSHLRPLVNNVQELNKNHAKMDIIIDVLNKNSEEMNENIKEINKNITNLVNKDLYWSGVKRSACYFGMLCMTFITADHTNLIKNIARFFHP